MTLLQKLSTIDWTLTFLLCLLGSFGLVMLYSVSGGSFYPLAFTQLIRFIIGLVIMIFIAVVDIRVWYKFSWLFFIIGVALLLLVYGFGESTMGARRWLNLGFFRIQPSEIMKVASVLAIARMYCSMSLGLVSSSLSILKLLLLMFIPVFLVYKQPDLGTAILLLAGAISMGFLVGISWKFILGGTTLILATVPFVWSAILRPYQRDRILIFLEPETDPLGSGYHIIQSKIAIGSGGLSGRGFMNGTQSNLGFLPEKHTDFIFTVVAEEFGFVGVVSVLLLVFLILLRVMRISHNSRGKYATLVSMGMGVTFFLYILINAGMVMGVFPVVGVPFPLISYGGTVMLSTMIGFGFVQNCWVHRDIEQPDSDLQ